MRPAYSDAESPKRTRLGGKILRGNAKFAFWLIFPMAVAGFRPCSAQTIASARATVTITVVSGISGASPVTLNLRQSPVEIGKLGLRTEASNGTHLKTSESPARMVWITLPTKTTLWNTAGDLLSVTPEIGWNALIARLANGSTAFEAEDNPSLASERALFIKSGGSMSPDGTAKGSYGGVYTRTVVY